MANRMHFGLIAIVVLVSLMVPSGSTEASSPARCASSSPARVVRAYYRALNQHQVAATKACLSSGYLARLIQLRVQAPDWTNVLAARVESIRVSRISISLLPPDVRPIPYRAVQVGAEVWMHYRRIGGSPNGLNFWFIYVIMQHPSSPWRIGDIGSGP